MAPSCSGGMCLRGRCNQPRSQACQPALPAAAVSPLPSGPLLPPSTLPTCTGQSMLASYWSLYGTLLGSHCAFDAFTQGFHAYLIPIEFYTTKPFSAGTPMVPNTHTKKKERNVLPGPTAPRQFGGRRRMCTRSRLPPFPSQSLHLLDCSSRR